jgi:hypothetical protein
MSYTFQVPDELYERLEEYAARRGQTPDELLLAYIEEIARQAEGGQPGQQSVVGEDPLLPFVGAFVFGVRDLAEHHDHYLAQAYVDDHMRGK